MYDGSSPTLRLARADPYAATSPRGVPTGVAEMAGGHPALPEQGPDRPRTSPVHPGTRHANGPRKSVKEATRTLPDNAAQHSDLAAKLQAKKGSDGALWDTQSQHCYEAAGASRSRPDGAMSPRGEGAEAAPDSKTVLQDDDPDLDETGEEE
eukprot:s5433_g3.t1